MITGSTAPSFRLFNLSQESCSLDCSNDALVQSKTWESCASLVPVTKISSRLVWHSIVRLSTALLNLKVCILRY